MLKWYGKAHLLFTYSSALLGIYYRLCTKGATENTELKYILVFISFYDGNIPVDLGVSMWRFFSPLSRYCIEMCQFIHP